MERTSGTGLAARLKEATRELHIEAERSGVMADLMRGRMSRAAYCLLLRNLQPIYAALEAGLDEHHADDKVRRLWRPELRRLAAIEQDLDQLHRGNWRQDMPPLPAANAYAERMQRLARTAPFMLLPHAYLRYLGDLHGGQMLARVVRQRFELQGPQGTAFYDFGDAQQVEGLKKGFRAGLDALDLTPEQADAFIEEACEAFRLHKKLFDELQACESN